MIRRLCLPILCLFPAVLEAQFESKPLDPANLDTTCAACTDFFTFANGGWIKRANIPGDLPAWGAF
jgi:putative endopeptidase